MTTPEPHKLIFLGSVSVEPDTAIAFDIPLNASPEQITAALEKLEADRAAAALAESEKLRKMFLSPPPEAEAEKNDEDKPQ
jgi:hypothetical protein